MHGVRNRPVGRQMVQHDELRRQGLEGIDMQQAGRGGAKGAHDRARTMSAEQGIREGKTRSS